VLGNYGPCNHEECLFDPEVLEEKLEEYLTVEIAEDQFLSFEEAPEVI